MGEQDALGAERKSAEGGEFEEGDLAPGESGEGKRAQVGEFLEDEILGLVADLERLDEVEVLDPLSADLLTAESLHTARELIEVVLQLAKAAQSESVEGFEACKLLGAQGNVIAEGERQQAQGARQAHKQESPPLMVVEARPVYQQFLKGVETREIETHVLREDLPVGALKGEGEVPQGGEAVREGGRE